MPQLYFSKQPIEVKNFHCQEVNINKAAECAKDWKNGFGFDVTIQNNPNLASFRRDLDLEYKQKQLAVEAAYAETMYSKQNNHSL